jgi:hypothetical protein
MLEHVDEAHIGKIRVRHNMSVESLTVAEDGIINLKWLQSSESQDRNGSYAVKRGMARIPFVVCWPLNAYSCRALGFQRGTS